MLTYSIECLEIHQRSESAHNVKEIWENNPSVQNMASFCNMESSFVHFEEWTQVANYAVWTHVAAKNHPKGKFHGRFCSDWPRPKLEVCFSLVSELPYTVAGGVAMLHREVGLGLPLSWSIILSIIIVTWPCLQGKHVCLHPQLPNHRDDEVVYHGCQNHCG